MKVLTFDLEVENYRKNKRLAAPFDDRNYIVEAGWNWNGGEVQSKRWDEWHRDNCMDEQFNALESGDIINGFNTKFDILWVWGQKSFQAALKRGAVIYCGQYVEYLLGGHTQDVQMCSMNDVAEQYGGGCKIDAVKEMWEEGYLTSQIPPDLLHDYLCGDGKEIVGDVMNTWLIFAGQIARMREHHPAEFRKMIKFRMDGLLATTEMEYNGVHCDKIIGEKLRDSLVAELIESAKHLETFLPELPPEFTFNWGSTQHKSCLIFGGVATYKKWIAHTDTDGNVIYAKKQEKRPLFDNVPLPFGECRKAGGLYVREMPDNTSHSTFEHKGKFYQTQDTYKSGLRAGEGKFKNCAVPDETKPKGAIQTQYFKFNGYTEPHHAWKSEQTDGYDNPLYSTGAKVIEKLAARGIPFTKALSRHIGVEKDLGTYYWKEDNKGKKKGMLTLVSDLGIIHHKLNHTSTVTSRLSSSDPNLQNIPRGDKSDVKQMFTSRFTNGRMAELDYSQLEVVVQGVLSQDKQLCQDLRDKVDFHCKRLAAKLGEDYQLVWDKCHKEEDPEYKKGRTNAKMFSFQRAYGAGADTISTDTGMPKSEVEALIKAEELLYPSIKSFDQELELEINNNRVSTKNNLFVDGVVFKQGESHWDSPTGTRYIWRENITPEFLHAKGKYTGFSPTERKNYPVQGFGGEIVQTMIGLVFRYLIENDRFDNRVLLVNTVHDCIWLDSDHPDFEKIAKDIQQILESVPDVFNTAYPELDITVPFPCETEVGNNMFDMNTLH